MRIASQLDRLIKYNSTGVKEIVADVRSWLYSGGDYVFNYVDSRRRLCDLNSTVFDASVWFIALFKVINLFATGRYICGTHRFVIGDGRHIYVTDVSSIYDDMFKRVVKF